MTDDSHRPPLGDARDDASPSGPRPSRRPAGSRARPLLAIALLAAVGTAAFVSTTGGSQAPRASGPAATTAAQRIDALLAGLPETGNALGKPTAPVTLQFFGDLECPTSRRFTLGALPFLVRRWVRPGELRIEYRSLRTATPEPQVFRAQQVAALAAGMQHKLWYYLELFYHAQGPEDTGYVTVSYLRNLALQTPGLNLAAWAEDRKDPLLVGEIDEDAQAAANRGLTTTPSFLIARTGTHRLARLPRFSTIDPSPFNIAIQHILVEPHAPSPAQVAARVASPRLTADVSALTPVSATGGAQC